METIIDYFSSLSHEGTQLALNGIWLGLALACAVWLLLRLTRRTAATTRVVAWWTTMSVVLALPLLMLNPPDRWLGSFDPETIPVTQIGPESPVVTPGNTAEAIATEETVVATTALMPNDAESAFNSQTTTEQRGAVSLSLRLLPALLSILWLTGLLLLGRKLWRSYRDVAGIKARSRPLNLDCHPRIERLLADNSGRRIRLGLSSEIDIPIAAGFLHPMVIIPNRVAEQLEDDDLEAIVRHELAHLKRWDDWTKLTQKLIETVFFFHPAVHLVGRQLELERELACDEAVVASHVAVDKYARCLTRLAQLNGSRMTSLIPGALTSRKQIFRRFERLLLHLPIKTTPLRSAIHRLSLVTVVIMTALFAVILAPAVTLPFEAVTFAELASSNTSDSSIPESDPAIGAEQFADNDTADKKSDTEEESDAPADSQMNDDIESRSGLRSSSSTSAVSGADLAAEIEKELASRNLSNKYGIEGAWEAEFKKGRPWIKLAWFDRRDSQSRFSVPLDALVGIDEAWRTDRAGDVRFLLPRDAGVFEFQGDFWQGEGEGEFTFQADEDYVRDLLDMGYRSKLKNSRTLYRLALFQVSRNFIREMEKLGYDDLSLDKLVEMRIHRVKPEIVEELRDLGYDLSADRLIEFQIHRVTPWFIKDMKDAGLRNLSADRLLQFRIHGLDPEHVHEFEEVGLDRLSPERLVEFRIHRVTPAFVKEFATLGYDHLSPDRLTEFRIHGVTPAMVSEFQELGYGDIDEGYLTKFRIHGVSPEFVIDLAELGYDRISPEDLVRMKIHGVSPSYVKRLRSKGFRDLSVEDLIDMRIYGID
jgi:beta-lactamase regulating signal transducer with metallopeptidase domain